MSTRNQAKTRVYVGASLRNGTCENCGSHDFEIAKQIGKDVRGVERELTVKACTQCGGQGQLICRFIGIQAPDPPMCLSPRCLFRYFLEILFYTLLGSYHKRRAKYAQDNRKRIVYPPQPDKDILPRYRTGEPSPTNLWQAIHANIKLGCPVCRKYNVDPLLFRRRNNGSI